MKYPIFGALVLLFLSQTSLAQQWEELSLEGVFNDQSTFVSGLRQVATGFVIQKGMFENTKAPFPGDYYTGGNDNTIYERRNTSTVTYYRFNFTLVERDGPSTVSVTAVISYNPSNFNFIVTSYRYNIDPHGNEEKENDHTSLIEFYSTDTRNLTGDGDLPYAVNSSFDSVIADHIKRGVLPDDNYIIRYIYLAGGFQYHEDLVSQEGGVIEEGVEVTEGTIVDDDEESSEPSHDHGYKYYEIYLRAKSSKGKYYLISMAFYFFKENGEFVFDKNSSRGGMLSYI